jgi:uncharacterized protein DUF4062
VRIFISSTYKDLRHEREAAALALEELGHHAAGQEDRVPIYDRPLELCLEDITSCDLLLSIVAWRYGSEAPGIAVSFVEAEYEKAIQAGIPRLAFLLREDSQWPDRQRDADLVKVRQLRSRMAAEPHVFFEAQECFRSITYKTIAALGRPGHATPLRIDNFPEFIGGRVDFHRQPPFGEGYLAQCFEVENVLHRGGTCYSERPYLFLTYALEDAPEYLQDKLRYGVLPRICGFPFIHSMRRDIEAPARCVRAADGMRSFLGRVLIGHAGASDLDIAASIRSLRRPMMLRVYVHERTLTPAVLESILCYWQEFPNLFGDTCALFVFLNIAGTRRSWRDMLAGRRSGWQILQSVATMYSDERLIVSTLPALEPSNVIQYLEVVLGQYLKSDSDAWEGIAASLTQLSTRELVSRRELVPLIRTVLQHVRSSEAK